MTTKECLHRFCAECIITALRSGNKECPTCRKKLVSKRSLRPDPNFDQLVAKLFPDKEECEEQQEKAGLAHAKRLCRKRSLPINTSEESKEVEDSEISKAPVKTLHLKLYPHKTLEKNLISRLNTTKTRFVETSSNATVKHLSQYIKTRMEIELGINNQENQQLLGENPVKREDVKNICLFIHDSGQETSADIKLNDLDITLESVKKEQRKKENPVEISFSFELVSS